MGKLPFATWPGPSRPTKGRVISTGAGVLTVDAEMARLRNVGVALPLLIAQISVGDVVILSWVSDKPYAIAVVPR